MNEEPSEHPTREMLVAFALGHPTGEEPERIERHLDTCAECTSWLTEQSVRDSLVEMMQTPHAAEDATRAPAVTRSLDSDADSQLSFEVAPMPTPRESDASKNVFGKFRLESVLGRGGMGIVYRALDSELKRPVALKILVAHGNPAMRLRMQKEAETVASLNHPGIVKIYEVGTRDGQPYMALELIEGGPLTALLKEREFNADDVAALLSQVAGAVEAAHQASVVHRDLKPENILVCPSPSNETVASAANEPNRTIGPAEAIQLKVTDFGIAMLADDDSQMTRTGTIIGTPAYMAPEQARGEREAIGPETDVYAMGVMLFQMLCGKVPFESPSTIGLIDAICSEDPPSIRKLQPSTPKDLETICFKCLAKEPAKRYQNASELKEDLNRFLNREPIRARPATLLERVVRKAKKYPLLASVYLVSIAAYGLHRYAASVEASLVGRTNGGLSHYEDDLKITGLIVGFAAAATLLEWLGRTFFSPRSAGLGFVVLTLTYATYFFIQDRGPQSGPVTFYTLLPLVTLLFTRSPKDLWGITLATCVCYIGLAMNAHWNQPQFAVSHETMISMLITLVVETATLQLLVARTAPRFGDSAATGR
ncbi:MAG: protein kinase [Planctomycetota bacterium]